MKELNIAICDDSITESTIIKEYCVAILNTNSIQFVICIYNSGKELLLSGKNFDILLLDVEMNDINGIEVKNIIDNNYKKTKIIFISNYQDRVLEAFGKNVFAYIEKSKLENLEHALMKLIKEWMDDDTIMLDNNLYLIKDIYYLEADSAYTNIHFLDKTILLRKNLKDFESTLKLLGFYRVHKSYIINLRYIESVYYSEVVLSNGIHIKISRGYHDKIKEAHFNFIREMALWK